MSKKLAQFCIFIFLIYHNELKCCTENSVDPDQLASSEEYYYKYLSNIDMGVGTNKVTGNN